MIRRGAAASILLCASIATAGGGQSHVDKATAAHAAGKFEVALAELQAAYDENPKPEFLYAIGQVQAKLGHCSAAIAAYEKFKTTVTDKAVKLVVQQAIDSCHVDIPVDEPKPPKPVPPPPETSRRVAEPPPAEPPHDEPEPPVRVTKRFYTDVVGDVLVGAGVVSGVVAVVMYNAARNELVDAERASTLAYYQDHVAQARDKRTVAVIAGIAGGVFVIGGLLRFAIHSETYTVGVAPAGDGGSVTFGGHF